MGGVPAGWFGDPVEPDRLRYWDGRDWTEWVSREGQTTSSPLPEGWVARAHRQPPPPVPGPVPGPSPAAPAAPGRGYPAHAVMRLAAALVGTAGVLAVVAMGRTLTQQAAVSYRSSVAIPVVGAVLLVAAAGMVWHGRVWVRLAALGTAAGAAVLLMLVMIGTRTSGDLRAGVHVDLRAGWWLVAAAAVLAATGTMVAAARFVAPAGGDDGRAGPQRFAVAGLVLALLGVLLAPLAALGAAMGMCGRLDCDASAGRIDGRRLSVAAVAVGLTTAAVWMAGLLITGFVITP
ncbi:MAG: DUF2510 domain-containing protein [Thermoleophilia bacterium]